MKKFIRSLTSMLAIAALLLVGASAPNTAVAAGVTSLSDTVTSHKISTASDHTIVFTLDAATTIIQNETLTVTIPSGDGAGEFFDSATNNVEFGDMDLEFSTSADATLAAAASATDWGVVVTDGAASTDLVITFTAPSNAATYVTGGETVTIQIGTVAAGGTNQIINPGVNSTTAAGGNLGGAADSRYTVDIGGTFGDSGSLVLPVLDDDQVIVTATVAPTLSFALSQNAVDFGDLTVGAARYATGGASSGGGTVAATAAHNFTIATNAAGGYNVTYLADNITSGANTITAATIAGDADGTPGTEQFGFAYDTDGDATVTASYDETSNNWDFAPSTTTPVTIVSETVPTATETVDAHYIANISALTETGLYTTTVTYTAIGTF